ncbi:MAG TPA: response regulator transcription factor [Solirubrobacteraceae bacterium]|nr:response regulator transcription factor [Solirubrobacteraceae bacterium]
MSAAAPRVVIADDHQAIRLGVRMSLMRGGFDVVAEAVDRDSAIAAAREEQPDVCLLDIRMPGGGIEAAAAIAEASPATAVVMLTVSNATEDVLAALRAGAVGYLPKDLRPDSLPAALCGVLRGEAALPRALVGRVLAQLRDSSAASSSAIRVGNVKLTPRESEILRMLSSGMTTTEVGKLLSLSPITVRRHVSASVAKLGVADREEAFQAILPLAASA